MATVLQPSPPQLSPPPQPVAPVAAPAPAPPAAEGDAYSFGRLGMIILIGGILTVVFLHLYDLVTTWL